MNAPFLNLEGVRVRLGRNEVLCEPGVSFSLARGEIAALLGPNGSGKSTLLRAVAGTVLPSHGKVFIDGKDAYSLHRRARALLCAYVPQKTDFETAFTVLESVLMGRYPHTPSFASYRPRDFDVAFHSMYLCGLEGFENRRVTELSGGEQARTAIARAIAQETPLLLLDEPTAALDPKATLEITSLIRSCADEGKTILIAMHEINRALSSSERVIFLQKGKLVAECAASLVSEELLQQIYGVKWQKREQLVAITDDE